MAAFKDVILTLRTENNFNQDQLAKALHVSRSTVGMWETGNRLPSPEIFDVIADYFNVDLDYLYGRSPIRKKVHFENDGSEYLPVDSVLNILDLDVRRILRAREKMSEQEKKRMMKILEASFEEYFIDK